MSEMYEMLSRFVGSLKVVGTHGIPTESLEEFDQSKRWGSDVSSALQEIGQDRYNRLERRRPDVRIGCCCCNSCAGSSFVLQKGSLNNGSHERLLQRQ